MKELIYNNYDDSIYQDFIDHSLTIFNKYKYLCNPNNKRLLKIDNSCSFDDHIHGGFMCGDNGIWRYKCVPSFCGYGYSLDIKHKKCIKDVCIKNMERKTVLLVFAIIFTIILVILFICTLIWLSDSKFLWIVNGILLIVAIIFYILYFTV